MTKQNRYIVLGHCAHLLNLISVAKRHNYTNYPRHEANLCLPCLYGSHGMFKSFISKSYNQEFGEY